MRKHEAGHHGSTILLNSEYSGFSTLELMIAMAVITLAISAAIFVSFGSQSMLVNGELSSIALNMSRESLEEAQLISRKDFQLLNPTSTDQVKSGIVFHRSLNVHTLSDFNTKQVMSTVAWCGEHGCDEKVELSSLVTNYLSNSDGNTCDSVLTGDWHHPQVVNAFTDFASLAGDYGGTYTITSIDVYLGRMYVSTNNSSIPNKPTLFVFDITHPSIPVLLGKVDNDTVNNSGVNAIKVAGNYLYAANASSFVRGQLQIFDITNPVPMLVSLFKISTSTVSGSSSQGKGNSVSYKDGYVYLGLNKTVSGPEFNIIDVHDRLHPFWVGGYAFGRTVNSIRLVGHYAYVVTAVNSTHPQELSVLDIGDPLNPVLVSSFDATNASGDGESIVVVGDRVYLGRASNSSSEFYLVENISSSTPSLVGIGTPYEVGSSVNNIIVRDYLSFLLTTNGNLHIVRTDHPYSISPWATTMHLPSAGALGGLDCEGNYIFAASNASGNEGALSVITSSP